MKIYLQLESYGIIPDTKIFEIVTRLFIPSLFNYEHNEFSDFYLLEIISDKIYTANNLIDDLRKEIGPFKIKQIKIEYTPKEIEKLKTIMVTDIL